jgi:hypothetical protein
MTMRCYSDAADYPIRPVNPEFAWDIPATVTRVIGGDPLMERLVRALLPEDEASDILRDFYADSLHAMLRPCPAVFRGGADVDSPRRKSMALPG